MQSVCNVPMHLQWICLLISFLESVVASISTALKRFQHRTSLTNRCCKMVRCPPCHRKYYLSPLTPLCYCVSSEWTCECVVQWFGRLFPFHNPRLSFCGVSALGELMAMFARWKFSQLTLKLFVLVNLKAEFLACVWVQCAWVCV